MKRGFLIFNPISGQQSKSKSLIATVIRQFERQGIDITPNPTAPDGIVLDQVRDLVKESPDLIVAWGGDGTINEVVNGMFGTEIPLGVLPGGTANVFAREMKLPMRLSDAIRLIGKGKTTKISVAQANHRLFILMAGIGFDSTVIANTDFSMKRKFGTFAFGVSAFQTARNYDFPKFNIRVGNETREGIFAVISNAKGYGAYFVLTPDADISDDYLYVCLFKEPGFPSMFRYFVHALGRKHHTLDSVEFLRGTEVEVVGAENIAVQADGELIGFLPMKFEIHPRSLTVFCK
jgi:diacylglycerol kinase (ATP)